MKNIIKSIILWPLSAFMLLCALMYFSESMIAGVLFLVAAILSNPIFLKFLRKHHIKFKKGFYIPAVVLVSFFGVFAAPTGESEDTAQTQDESIADLSSDVTNDADITADTLSELSIHFIDVGQGDATLILCDSHAMLIDAGDNSKGTALQLYLNKQGVDSLDYLVLTHPDADHIGGADVIITKFDIDHIFMSDYAGDTKTYEEVLDALEYKNEKWSTPAAGDTFAFGDASFTILAPLDTYNNPNDSSIALMLNHGNNKFLFTGDCSEKAENDLVGGGQSLSADVYQVGHHGSRYSSSQVFMDAVTPTYAVISCGEDNSYGHPSAEAMNRFRTMGIQVFRTDEQGSIVATSDGTDITWNCAPSDTWKAGESTMSSSEFDDISVVVDPQDTATVDNPTASEAQDTATVDNPTVAETQDTATVDNPTVAEIQDETAADNTSKSSDTTQTGGSGSGTNAFETGTSPGVGLYIGNKNNGKLHRSTCHKLPKNENQAVFNTREEAVAAGYNDPCKLCNP